VNKAIEAPIVQSRAERVTLFEDRAEVIRKLTCNVPAGLSRVRVEGVSAAIDDASLLARSAGEAVRVLQSRVIRRVRQAPAAGEGEIEGMEREAKEATERRVRAEREMAARHAELERLEALLERWREAIARVPRNGESNIADWAQARGEVEAAQHSALDAFAKGSFELGRARTDEARARQRLEIGRTLHPRFETLVELQLEAASAAEVPLELVYRTPCALWRPEHLARLLPASEGEAPRLEIVTFATVWQSTGEAWGDVRCRFSTARPAQAASPPLLAEEVLRLRKKTDEEKRTVVIQARDQTVRLAGLDRGDRAADEMPGVDDGGQPLFFEPASPATLPSDGQPVRVEIGRRLLPCKVDRVAFAERTERAHLRATATLTGEVPLLAGPVWLARGAEMVGRGRTHFVAVGEPFELGLGGDEGLTVRRRSHDERETTPIIGTQKLTRTVELFLSNTGGEPRRLRVTERFPVSEIADLKVELLKKDGAQIDRQDGFLHFDLELAPRSTKKLELSYRLEAPAKVALPF
jgi:uncharacterized protein (TIGR02231 family)